MTMSVYTSADEPPPELLRALGRLVRVVGLETVETSEVERGSWFRRWRLRDTTGDGFRKLANKAQRAGELHFIQQVRAQADEHEANAVASVIRAVEGMDSAVVQLSSMVIVKHQGGLICRVLSEREIGVLANHPELLKSPGELFQLLSAKTGPGMGNGGGRDNEHRRRVPIDEEDLFSGDEKSAPPVIGL